MLELDIVVIGGGVAQAGDTLFVPLGQRMAGYATLDFTRGLPVAPALFALDAGLDGTPQGELWTGAHPAAPSVRRRGGELQPLGRVRRYRRMSGPRP